MPPRAAGTSPAAGANVIKRPAAFPVATVAAPVTPVSACKRPAGAIAEEEEARDAKRPQGQPPLDAKRPPAARPPAQPQRPPEEPSVGNTLRIPEVDEVPTIFEFDADAEKAYGLFVDSTRCMMGDELGLVVDVNRWSGKPLTSFRLPGGVKCIVGDGDYLYVGTNDGDIFDLSDDRVRLVAKIEEFGALLWIDIKDGLIAASDQNGYVGLLNEEGEVVWKHHSGGTDGWLCRIDSTGIYHGCSNGVRKYNLRGQLVWTCKKRMDVTFGVQTDEHLWVMGVVSRKDSPEQTMVAKINKATGDLDGKMQFSGIDSCCVSPDLKRVYDSRMNIQPANVQLAKWTGAAWKNCTLPMETIFSMQAFGNHVFAVGSRPEGGSKFACFDVSDKGIIAAAAGHRQMTQSGSWGAADRVLQEASGTVDEVTSAEGKIIIGCILDGSKLRARVESPGYDPTLNVQFQRNLRKPGARFTVDNVELAPNGNFYRCRGEIKRLRDSGFAVDGSCAA
eukprot:TRINITY_DN76362_c0_g1_i1.p1 TRINITY_DN76362_c0_g1~~TRINITY_DN76362_c0_g1_i1.p1  ORF type:complete len:525 (-),score=88.34 TRINITY_DN76362_c0_g1_i1:152-1663(-)